MRFPELLDLPGAPGAVSSLHTQLLSVVIAPAARTGRGQPWSGSWGQLSSRDERQLEDKAVPPPQKPPRVGDYAWDGWEHLPEHPRRMKEG